MNPTIHTLTQHRTYRQFQTAETLPTEHLQAIINSARQAPSWMNGQHYSIINISDPALRQHIVSLQPNNPQIGECAVYLIFLADLHRADLCRQAYEGTFAAAGTADALITAVSDASFAAQNAVIAAESLGYATCYTGGIRQVARELVELLGLPSHTFPLYGLCIGTPAVEMPVKPRLPEHTVYNHNRYPSDTVLQEGLAQYESTLIAFAEAREKLPYRDKFARYYSRPYTPHNSRLMQSLGWLTDTE